MKNKKNGKIFLILTFLIAVLALIIAIAAYKRAARNQEFKITKSMKTELNKLKLRIALLEARAEVLAANLYLESKEKVNQARERLDKAKERLEVALGNVTDEVKEKINKCKNKISTLIDNLRPGKTDLSREREKIKETEKELEIILKEEATQKE